MRSLRFRQPKYSNVKYTSFASLSVCDVAATGCLEARHEPYTTVEPTFVPTRSQNNSQKDRLTLADNEDRL